MSVQLLENGSVIGGDIITALMAQIILREKSKAKILYDVRASKVVEEVIEEAGGKPVVWKVGHSFIKLKMKKDNILFGGEVSAHYFHKDHYYCECPIFVLVSVINEILDKDTTLSKIIKPFKKYSNSGEINFEVKDEVSVLEKLEKRFKDGRISKIDGVRVDYPDWWFLARPSNTEPLLRLIAEAQDKNLLQQKVQLITDIIEDKKKLQLGSISVEK